MRTNLISERSGRAVANQFVEPTANGIKFISYTTHIATIENGKVSLNYYYWDYSRTTLKYLCQFLRQCGWHEIKGKKDVEKMIKNGTFKTF